MMILDDYRYISRLVESECGIVVSEDGYFLIEARMSKLARELEYPSVNELIADVRKNSNRKLINQVLDSMTTNESLFFRDEKPFQALSQTILPDLLKKRSIVKSIRIWSAACSTGQEPFSIAMSILESPHYRSDFSFEILATDISHRVLERARTGVFSELEINRGLPKDILAKYFAPLKSGYAIKESIRKLVTFRHLNLIEPFPNLGPFDIIFCRNVMIYFNTETKKQILDSMAGTLASDGYLFLGGAETTLSSKLYERVQTNEAVYHQVKK